MGAHRPLPHAPPEVGGLLHHHIILRLLEQRPPLQGLLVDAATTPDAEVEASEPYKPVRRRAIEVAAQGETD